MALSKRQGFYACAIVFCAVVIPLTIVARLWWDRHANPMLAMREDLARTYGRLEMAALGPSSDSVYDTLSHAWISPPPAPDLNEKLLRTVADFLHAAFVNDSPETYRAWRAESGARLQSIEELARGPVTPTDGWLWYFHSEIPEGMAVETIFDKLWEASRSKINGVNNRLKRIAATPDGEVIEYSTVTSDPEDEQAWPGDAPTRGPDSITGVTQWHGGPAPMVAARPWWAFPHKRAEIIARDGKAQVATVGLIGEFANGERCSMIIVLFWDTFDRKWIVEHLLITNRPAGSVASVPEI